MRSHRYLADCHDVNQSTSWLLVEEHGNIKTVSIDSFYITTFSLALIDLFASSESSTRQLQEYMSVFLPLVPMLIRSMAYKCIHIDFNIQTIHFEIFL